MVLEMVGDERSGLRPGSVTTVVGSAASEGAPAFSPDGHWLAYQSDESGRAEIYVQPFPGPGARRQVSSEGGNGPVWSRTGAELLFVDQDRRIMATPVNVSAGALRLGTPRQWTPARVRAWNAVPRGPVLGDLRFDLHPDGRRVVLVPAAATEPRFDHIVLRLGFFSDPRTLTGAP